MSEGSLGELGSARVRVVIDASGVASELNKVKSDVKQGANGISGLLGAEAIGWAKTLSEPFIELGKFVYESVENIEKSFIKLETRTGKTGASLASLKDDFIAALRDTPSSFDSISDSVARLSTRTGQTGEALQTLTKQFAYIERWNGEKPIEEVTRAFAAWNVKSEDQTSTLDYLFRASQKSDQSIGSLASSVVEFQVTLSQMGLSLDQSIALMAQLSKDGANAGRVMMALNKGIANLSEGGIENLSGAIAGISEAIQNAGSAASANKIAIEFFGARAGTELAKAIREGKLSIDDFQKSIENTHSTILETSGDVTTYGGIFAKFGNKVTAAFEPMEKDQGAFKGAFKSILDAVASTISELVTWFSSLDNGSKIFIASLVGITAAIGPVVALVAGSIALWGAFGAAIIGAAAPIAIIVTAIAALVTAIYLAYEAWKNWDSIVDFMTEIGKGIADVLDGIIFGFSDLLVNMGIMKDHWNTNLAQMTSNIYDWAKESISWISKVAVAAASPIKTASMIGNFLDSGETAGSGSQKTQSTMAVGSTEGEGDIEGAASAATEGMNKLGAASESAGTKSVMSIDAIRGAMGKAKSAADGLAKSLSDAMSARYDAHPVEGLIADLKKVDDLAKQFPQTMDASTLASEAEKSWKKWGETSALNIDDVRNGLQGLNPVFMQTIDGLNSIGDAASNARDAMAEFDRQTSQNSLLSEMTGGSAFADAKKTIDDTAEALDRLGESAYVTNNSQSLFGSALWNKIQNMGSQATRILIDGMNNAQVAALNEADALESVGDKTERAKNGSDDFKNAINTASETGNKLSSIGSNLERINGKATDASRIFKAIGTGVNIATDAMNAFVSAGGGIQGVVNAVITVVADLLGLMGSAEVKIKLGWDRMTTELGKKFNDWADDITDTLTKFVETGKFEFNDLVKSISEDILKIAIKWSIVQPIMTALGVPSTAFAAKGAVNDGGIMKYAGGGVVSRRTAFNLSAGMDAVIGEGARSEGYFPLTRMHNGDLGVSAAGLGSQSNTQINVINQSGRDAKVSETIDPDGMRRVQVVIENVIESALTRGRMDNAMTYAFGVARRGSVFG